MTKKLQRLRNWLSACRPRLGSHSTEVLSDKYATGVKVTVVPVLDDSYTTARAISHALIKLSYVMAEVNNSKSGKKINESLTRIIATAIMNIVNAMATVPDRAKPRKICAYHVFATATAIANFLNARSAVYGNRRVEWPDAVMRQMAGAYTYLGMAVLATPAAQSTNLAATIATAVTDAMRYTTKLSPAAADRIAEDIASESNLTGAPPNPPPYQPALVSVLTKYELEGMARELAVKTAHSYTPNTFADAAALLDLGLFGFPCRGGCRRQGRPVCFCKVAPLSRRRCKIYLLPEV
ncbi:hypothetical protein B0T21DRAFT_349509 [Apiosordaria backusii]|uniref:Uncharacterized protein n=1 Tax=Apiosordaria backusii TaxID=314023 RepID=A0AA40BE23_9PEZI|nr:hypothetical protein B0T21DRAFT_349509 [Apiosordaria backusii]